MRRFPPSGLGFPNTQQGGKRPQGKGKRRPLVKTAIGVSRGVVLSDD